jgi:hypothetical protein
VFLLLKRGSLGEPFDAADTPGSERIQHSTRRQVVDRSPTSASQAAAERRSMALRRGGVTAVKKLPKLSDIGIGLVHRNSKSSLPLR